MDIGLLVSFAGIFVAGLAGVLGVWMERDRAAPPFFAMIFSFLIGCAALVEVVHAVKQAAEDAITEEAMARVLEQLAELAESGNNPALTQFVGAELAAQARTNPGVVERLEKKVAAKGGDPTAIRRQAAEARRSTAGLPARPPAKAGAGRPGSARTTKAGGPEAKAGRTGLEGKIGKAEGKAGKAGDLEGKAGKAAADAADAAAKAGKAGAGAADAAAKAGKAAGAAADGAAKAGKAANDAAKKVGDIDPAKAGKVDPTKAKVPKVEPPKVPSLK